MKTVPKNFRIGADLVQRAESISSKLGLPIASVLQLSIRYGIPIVERGLRAMQKASEETYPLEEITALRAAETPKKSNRP